MFISWVELSIAKRIKPFSLGLEKNDFLFLAGETCHDKLLRALAGFLPEECNSDDAIRINGQRIKDGQEFNSVLLPKNAANSFPPHRTIGQFALDLSPTGTTHKKIESHAGKHGITKEILCSKPSKLSPLNLQKISLWLASLNTSTAIFIEEPDNGFFNECRPFDFLQDLLRTGVTSCIIYLTEKKNTVVQKAKAMQFCRSRLAVFCTDRLVEEGEAVKILDNPIHSYTKDWITFGSSGQRRKGALWQYCMHNCPEQHSCPAKQNTSSALWDYDSSGLHKVICKGRLNNLSAG